VDRLTSVVIEGIVASDSSLDEVKKSVEATMEQFPLPPASRGSTAAASRTATTRHRRCATISSSQWR
jgi:hypothetical protein